MTKKNIKGEILSPGVLAGRLHFFEPRTSVVAEEAARIDDPEAEIERFEKRYYFCSARCRDEFAHGAEERAG